MNRYAENNYQKFNYIKISELYKNKKYDLAIKCSTDFLNQVPNHIAIRFMRAKSYRFLGYFDKSIEDLKYILSSNQSNHAVVELFYLYYHLNKYNDAMELLPILYKYKLIKPISLYFMETIMRKQLGMPINSSKGTGEEYLKSQIINFSKDKTLEHMSIHTNVKIPDKDMSKFNKNIDLNYLYDIVQENINHSKKVNTEETLEIHYFSIFNIGVYNAQTCNCIKVAVIPNTLDIVTIYPTTSCNTDQILNYDREKLFPKPKEKTKGMSRIDKFKNRYNM